ncbi:hypothetical protein PROPEN_04496 [Proteus penneri ATCC 35198]|nr:hypothetical protein PROPEN_04496 [Proteus penneri ATCC 35198]
MSDNVISSIGTNQTGANNRVQLRKTLTLMQVVMMGLAFLQPMTIFDTFGIVSGITNGHVATSYAIALIAILFTAVSYGKLVKRFPSAGSAYTYAQKIHESLCWVYGRLVIFTRLFIYANDQYFIGENLFTSNIPGR